jgi:hypothetical protein
MMRDFPGNEDQWTALVDSRRDALREFLMWANSRERSGRSMRLANRTDLSRVREIVPGFPEQWWRLSHTCFDSVTGTLAVAPYSSSP